MWKICTCSGTVPGGAIKSPPSTNTKGKAYSNFKSCKMLQVWQIDGQNWVNQNANKPHSLKQVDQYAVRFEVRQGDVWAIPAGMIPATIATRYLMAISMARRCSRKAYSLICP